MSINERRGFLKMLGLGAASLFAGRASSDDMLASETKRLEEESRNVRPEPGAMAQDGRHTHGVELYDRDLISRETFAGRFHSHDHTWSHWSGVLACSGTMPNHTHLLADYLEHANRPDSRPRAKKRIYDGDGYRGIGISG
jgi:hypothetical protein